MSATNTRKSKIFNTKKQGERFMQMGLGSNKEYWYYNHLGKYKAKYDLNENQDKGKGRNVNYPDFIYAKPQDIKNNTRLVHLVQGGSGSGKSTFTANFVCRPFIDNNQDSPIYLISPKKYDPVFDDSDLNIHRIVLDESNFVDENTKLKIEEFLYHPDESQPNYKSCLCIYDDIEGCVNKKVQKGVFDLMNNMMTNGRSLGLDVCVIAHNMNHRDFITSKNEMTHLVIFPKQLNKKIIDKYLYEGMGLFQPARDKIMNGFQTRHLIINPRSNIVMTPTSVHVIDNPRK